MSDTFKPAVRCDGNCGLLHFLERFPSSAATEKARFAAVRKSALASGWSRFRVKTSGTLGDYCPDCTKKLTEK